MTLTSAGLVGVRDNTKSYIEAEVTYIAVGDDDTTPTAADTALGNEQFRSAVDDTDTSGTGKVIHSLRIATTENNGNDVDEVGAFDASSSGNMLSRDTITTIAKTSDIQIYLDLEYEIQANEVASFD